MRVGLFARRALSFGAADDGRLVLDDVITEARRVEAGGLASYWLPQQVDVDALTLAGVLGREVPRIEIGTAVVPMQTRFPLHMAQAALTAQALSGGRFTLGIGVEHDWVVRDMWGLPFDRPVAELAEYVEIVTALLATGKVRFQGEVYAVDSFLARFRPAPETQVLLGALGPRMLRLAGTRAHGTSTWLAGVATVRDHVVPTITRAAEDAGRRRPRVLVLLPIAVTDDEASVRRRIDEAFDLYLRMPSYRAVLGRQQAERPSDVALVGPAAQVQDQLAALAAAGATDFGAIVFAETEDERQATWDLLTEPL
jgi:5,10-methylenetetrahydromethanopterin reductase